MTGFLASVTDEREALLALVDGGADIIDCKDPAGGALGALPAATVQRIVAKVSSRRPVSATIGDLPTDVGVLAPAVRRTAAAGVDYVKLGLFRADALETVLWELAPLARRHRLVAVLFADLAPRLEILPVLADAGFAGVMLDTARKGGATLLDHAELPLLADFVQRARGLNLLCGLAGSLRASQVRDLAPLGPDYLGFRGALCAQGRSSALCPEALRRVRRCLDAADPSPGPRSTGAMAPAQA
jgi:dihydroneopterin aldolase